MKKLFQLSTGIIAAIIIIALSFTSCSKDEDPEPKKWPAPNDIRS